jgi:hypothetical protein
MPLSLSPEERTLRARTGAHALHSKYSGQEITAAARAAGPGSDDYWLEKVDPDQDLKPAERARRAAHAKKSHYSNLALRSSIARRKNREGAQT